MPKLAYPAYFENGLEGARVKEEIEHREGFLYVPHKMILSVSDTANHKVLGPIIEKYPESFDMENEPDYAEMILTLAIFYEVTLGKKSYWYPYLRMISDANFAFLWDEKEIEMT